MLYNKNWDKTKVDPFTLDNLITWLKNQPADQTYEFTDCAGCALAQYFTFHGFQNVNMGIDDFDYDTNLKHTIDLPSGWNDLVNPPTYERDWNTFGAVLKRAREMAG